MIRNYEDLLSAGNKAQLEKLEENSHKRGFDNIDLNYAHTRIKEEMSELDIEINGLPHDQRIDFKKVRREAADVANFAHMIIFKCDQEIK